MSSLKNFRIWLGWWFGKHVFISLLIIFAGLILIAWPFMQSVYAIAVLNQRNLSSFFHPSAVVIIRFACGTIAVLVFFWATASCVVEKNWRSAIDEAEIILHRTPLSREMYLTLKGLKNLTASTKNSSEIGIWIKDWRNWSSLCDEMNELLQFQSGLVKKISGKKSEIAGLDEKLSGKQSLS